MIDASSRPADFDKALVAQMADLRGFCISLTRKVSAGEDLLQEALAKALTNHAQFQPGTNMRAWLFMIARNAFLTDLRKAGREVSDATGAIIERAPAADDPDARLQALAVMDRIGRLPCQMRHMVNEIALGAEYSDVAAEMGLAEGTVKSRLNRVRAHLTEVTT
jgi:RNA polymerase sigma-70 factor, ECF subfamily